MPIPRPSFSELTNRIFSKLQADSSITAPLDTSHSGRIAKIMAAEMDAVWAWEEERDIASSPTTAIGGDLDSWGSLIGVQRKQATQASSLGQARAVRFTNTGAGSVTVPAGIRVFKESDPQIAFFTSESIALPAGQSGEVHANAEQSGEIFNVGIGEINRHSLPNVSVSVTNILPIISGSSQESDSSFRDRILQGFRRRTVLNRENVVALLRGLGGVKDVFLLDKNRGAGTFDVVIIPYVFSSVNTIIEDCQRLLDQNVPVGISALAKGPIYRQVDITINLRFDPTTGDRQESIRQSIRNQIQSIIDNLPVEDGRGSGTFHVGRVKAIATLSDNQVLDAIVSIGIDGSPIANEGDFSLNTGERLLLRSISVV